MTQPGYGADADFAKAMANLAVGNNQLQENPQVAFALTNSGATPAEAGTVNAFMKAQQDLQGMQGANELLSVGAGNPTLGQPTSTDYQAQTALNQSIQQQQNPGGLSGIWHAVTHNPIMTALNDVTNIVNATTSEAVGWVGAFGDDLIHGTMHYSNDFGNSIADQMKTAGYDPNNPFSQIAWYASGQQRKDLTDLQKKTDPNLFHAALRFADNPDEYERQIAQSTALSPQQKADQIAQMNSPEFQNLVKQMDARAGTVGHYLFDTNSTLGKWLAFATDLAINIELDPLSAVGQAAKLRYLAPVSLAGAAEKDMGVISTALLKPITKNYADLINGPLSARARIQAGFDYMIKATTRERELKADALSSDAQKAQNAQNELTQLDQQMRINARGLYPYKQVFHGTQVPVDFAKGGLTPENIAQPFEFGEGDPITSKEQAAEVFGSFMGATLLRLGQPVEKLAAMPGRMGLAAVLPIRSAIANSLTSALPGKAQRILNKSVQDALDALPTEDNNALVDAAEDPAAAAQLQQPGGAPAATAATAPTAPQAVLASQARADMDRFKQGLVAQAEASFAARSGRTLDQVQSGEQLSKLQNFKNSLKPSTYIPRAQLLAQRWSSGMNASDVFNVNDALTGDKVFKYAQLFLPRGHAHMMQALYDMADEGGRKDILHGLLMSQMHAAGWGTTAAGLAAIEKKSKEFKDALYSVTGSDWLDPATKMERDSAVWASQLNEKLTMPSFKELLANAPRIGVWENTVGSAMSGPLASHLMDLTRIGWILKAGEAIRNVQEDLASVFGRGRTSETFAAYLAARQRNLLVKSTFTGAGDALTNKIISSPEWQAHIARASTWVDALIKKGVDKLTPDDWGIADYADKMPKEQMQQMLSDFMSVHMKQMMNPDADVRFIARNGGKPTKVLMGYDKTTALDDADAGMGGSMAYSAWLKQIFGEDTEHSMDVLEHVMQRLGAPRLVTDPESAPNVLSAGRKTPHQVQDRIPIRYDKSDVNNTKVLGLQPGTSKTQLHSALDEWNFHTSGSTQPPINKALQRGGKLSQKNAQQKAVLDAALSKSRLGEDTVLYRGFQDGKGVLPKNFNKDLTGHTFNTKGYMPTSADPDVADAYAGDVADGGFAMRIHVPKGTGAIAMKDRSASGLDDEKEVLLPANMTLKIVKDHGMVNGNRWVDAVIVPKQGALGGAPRALTEDELLSKWQTSKFAPQKFSRNSRYLADSPDGSVTDTVVGTDEERQAAFRQHLQLQIREMQHMFTNIRGDFNQKLADYMWANNGKAPDAFWISQHIPNQVRPNQVIGAMYDEIARKPGMTGFLERIMDPLGRGYARMVEAPIARYSTQPQFMANFTRSMKEYEGVRKILQQGGMKADRAMEVSQMVSMNRAWNSTLRYIDNPQMRTQMDVVGKAFFGFSRATTGFIRRWGRQIAEDPTRLRRLQLLHEASTRAGVVYTDENGQEQFVFPGSGVAMQAINAGLAHLGITAYVPGLLPNLTSQVQFLNPALQNPFSYSLTPIGNIPLRALEQAMPGHTEMLDSVDQFLNGQNGPGTSFAAQFEPSVARNIVQAFDQNDKDSMYADAFRAATLNLAAAGKLPGPNATNAQIQLFQTQLRATIKNQLIQRAVFAFFAPAAPSSPTEETKASTADAEFQAMGFRTLDEEYKSLVNQMGAAEAGVVWAEIHPDKMMYTVSTTQLGNKSANVQATESSLHWIQQNMDFMKNYSGVAAYFVPQSVQKGTFSYPAYSAELQLGLRQHKTTEDFYNQVAGANANQQYFQLLAARDAAIQADPNQARSIHSSFAAAKQQLLKQNPILADTQPDYGAATTAAQDQLAQLQDMVQNGDAPKGVDLNLITQMLDMYDEYHANLDAFSGSSTRETAAKIQLSAQYNEAWQSFLASHPDMGGVYAGVFRALDNKALDPLGSVS